MGSRIVKGMGIRERLEALQQFPMSPESRRHASTSQLFHLLVATGRHSCLLLPHRASSSLRPHQEWEKSLQSLSRHSDTLQGYFPCYRVILICLAIEELLASVREFIFLEGTHWQSSVWKVFSCGHYVSMYMNKILIWLIIQDKYIQFSLLHQTQQYLSSLGSQQSWEGWFSVLPQNEK